MANNTTNNCNTINKLERNSYFYGKLLTVKDFQMEQEYFINKIRLTNQLLQGAGIIYGLEIENTALNGTKISFDLTEGAALDCCGNMIIVRGTQNFAFTISDSELPDNLYVYITYDECEQESVPAISNVTSTCGEEQCCFNRVIETCKVDITSNINEVPAACSYTINENPSNCKEIAAEAENHQACNALKAKVTLACLLKKTENGEVMYAQDDTCTENHRCYIHSNKMLFDLICNHVTADNPHNIPGAIASINNIENPGGNINLISGDNTIDFQDNSEAKNIDVRLSESFQEQLAEVYQSINKMQTVFKYIRERALKCTVNNFKIVAEKFDSSASSKLSFLAKKHVNLKDYEDETKFLEVLKVIYKNEYAVAISLKKSVTSQSYNDLLSSLKDLNKEINKKSCDILQAATLQDEVCFYVLQLESGQGETECQQTLSFLITVFRNISTAYKSENALSISNSSEAALKNNACGNEGIFKEFVSAIHPHLEETVGDLQGKVTEESLKNFERHVNNVNSLNPQEGTIDTFVTVLAAICQAGQDLEQTTLITVPSFVGQNVNLARTVILRSGLSVGKITKKISPKKEGTVLSHSPVSGTQVEPKTAVNLVVAIKFTPIRPPVRRTALTSVSGIGDITANKLSNNGITSAELLAKSNSIKVSDILGISTEKANTLINNAKLRIRR